MEQTIEEEGKTELTLNSSEIEGVVERDKISVEGKKICVIGGKWKSTTIEQCRKLFVGTEFDFISSHELHKSVERVGLCDFVVFDTSRNSHTNFYRAKKYNSNMVLISKSAITEIEKRFTI